MMRILSTALAAAAAIAAVPASAAIVEVKFTNIVGSWFDANFTLATTPNSIDNAGPLGPGSATVRWGIAADAMSGQSGYDFEPLGDLTFMLDTTTNQSAVGNIALFRHVNFPILMSGGSLTGIKLNFKTDVLIDGNPAGTTTFVYAFDHFETPNADNPCADGGVNGVGVNINGCADRVRVNFNTASGGFTYDGTLYALTVRGFLVGGNPATEFWTAERLRNEAFVQGQVVTRAVVPEPATWAMLIAGFGMVGASMRRRARGVARVSA